MASYPDLRDASVLITGGANGIGAAMVQGFQAQGASVAFCDIDSAAGRQLAKQTNAAFTRVDLRDEAAVSSWVGAVGKVNVLVNNAARDPRIALEKTTRDAWDDLFATNLRALMFTCKAAARKMRPGGTIINFSSITFHTAPAEMTAYVATKAAILGFTRSLARELGPRRIRVNAISPGWVMTDRQLRDYVTPAVKRLIRRSQCIPDPIEPADIAEVALFLASRASAALTGQELLADRGWAHS